MEGKIAIAHFLATNFFGGPEKQLLEHVQRLDKKRFLPQVVSFDESGKPNQLLEKMRSIGIPTKEIPSANSFDPRMIIDLVSVMRKEKIKLICVHGYKANIIGRVAAWIAGIPVIAISRGWTGEDTKIKLYEWLDKRFLHFANHIVAVSHGQKEKITKLGIPLEHISVIHNSIAVPKDDMKPKAISLRQKLGVPDHAVLVASAGRLSPEKNYVGMIESARIVAASNKEVFFVIFGEGVLRSELQQSIETAGLGNRFLLPGFRTDLQTALQEIDVFMLPSFTEGLPNVILEAFVVGKPVVATRVGGTPEVVEEGISGFLTEPHEIADMARYVLQLAQDPALRHSMGSRGQEYVLENFGFEHQTQAYEQLYWKIVNQNR